MMGESPTDSTTAGEQPLSEPQTGPPDFVQADAPTAAELGIDLPSNREQAIEILLAEVAAARGDATSYLDDLRRVAADFDNFRKRALRDQQVTVERAAERVLVSLLPVLDSFDAALKVELETTSAEKLMEGLRSTHNQLIDVLAKEGLEPVPTFEEPFDPEVHEAVMSTGDGSRLIVADELRRGYRLRGKVIRAALVSLEGRD